MQHLLDLILALPEALGIFLELLFENLFYRVVRQGLVSLVTRVQRNRACCVDYELFQLLLLDYFNACASGIGKDASIGGVSTSCRPEGGAVGPEGTESHP